jgi:hypothetical protein
MFSICELVGWQQDVSYQISRWRLALLKFYDQIYGQKSVTLQTIFVTLKLYTVLKKMYFLGFIKIVLISIPKLQGNYQTLRAAGIMKDY